MAAATSVIYLSDQGWMRWGAGESAPEPWNGNRAEGGAVYCYGVKALGCFPMWAQSHDPEIVTGLVGVEVEQRRPGMKAAERGRHVGWIRVGENGGTRQQLLVFLAGEATAPPEERGRWMSLEPGVSRFPLPEDRITLWREDGDWVVGVTRGKTPVYVHPLGALDEEAVGELRCLLMELEGKGFTGMLRGVTLWSEASAEEKARLETALGLPVGEEARPRPRFQGESELDLVPEELAEARHKAVLRWRMRAVALGGVALLGLVLVWGAISISWREGQNRRLETKLAEVAPEVEVIREARDRWEALGPAVDPTRYPVEIFFRVASLIPRDEMRFTSFLVEGDKVALVVESSSVPAAIRFRSEVMSHPDLQDYKWTEVPQPEVLAGGNRARLRMGGIYRYGETEIE